MCAIKILLERRGAVAQAFGPCRLIRVGGNYGAYRDPEPLKPRAATMGGSRTSDGRWGSGLTWQLDHSLPSRAGSSAFLRLGERVPSSATAALGRTEKAMSYE